MKNERIACFLLALCLLLLPAAAWAQTALSGTLAGVAQDTSGAVLPGVTVEAASPALIEKVRVVVTDDQGLYRIVDLRPGVYTVTFTLPGFATFRREGLELTTGFTATVNAELRVGALEETITVSGASPVVDIQNVSQQKVLSRDVLDALPTGKASLPAFASLIPGAVLGNPNTQDVGGNRGEVPASFGIHGTRGADMKRQQDGMRYGTIEGGNSGQGVMIDTGAVQEITLTLAPTAESETGGIQVNIVPKEGGNAFAYYGNIAYTNGDLQNSNLTDELRARGLNTEVSVRKVYDYNGALGGPIRKDSLWFYTSHRRWGASQFFPGTFYNKTQGSRVYTPDFSRPAFTHDWNQNDSLRLTWQASQKNKVNASYAYQDGCGCFFGMDGNTAPEASSSHRYQPLWLAQITWSYPATNRLLFEAGASQLVYRFNLRQQPEVSRNDIPLLELSRNLRYNAKAVPGGFASALGGKYNGSANQRFSVSYITGSHAFKTGVFLMEGFRTKWTEVNGDVQYTLSNGIPQSVTYFATPHREKQRLLPLLGIFTQDQWTIRNLTLNLGVRFDYINAYVPALRLPAGQFVPAADYPAVHDVPNWKDLSPRLGASYDLFGNSKTALKVSLGRYVAGEGTSLSQANTPSNQIVTSATRTWNDANNDFIPQENELGPISDTAFGQTRITTRYADDVLHGYGVRDYNWQGSAAIQHELRPGIGLNLAYYRTWYGNFRAADNLAVTPADYNPFCITAPVDARLPGGGGNLLCGLYDVTPGKFGRVDSLISQASNFGKQTEVYNGVDATINARFGQGGLLTGGLSAGRTVTDNCFVVDSPQQARDGFCHVSPPWSAGTQVKLSGVYPLPWDFQASAAFQYIPGIPIAASYVATNAQIAPSLGRNLAQCGARIPCTANAVVDLIPPGTLYEDRISQLDVRLTKIVRVRRGRVQGSFDVYNVLNASPILQMNTRYGPAWLQPTLILAGRLFKFGVQVDF